MARSGRTRVLDGKDGRKDPPVQEEVAEPAGTPQIPPNSADALIARRKRWLAELERFEHRGQPPAETPPRQP